MEWQTPSFYADNEAVASGLVLAVKLLDKLTPPRRLNRDTLEDMGAIMSLLDVVVRGEFRKVRRQRVSRKVCGAACGLYAVFADVLRTEEVTAEQWNIMQSIRRPLDWFAEQMERLKPPLSPRFELPDFEDEEDGNLCNVTGKERTR